MPEGEGVDTRGPGADELVTTNTDEEVSGQEPAGPSVEPCMHVDSITLLQEEGEGVGEGDGDGEGEKWNQARTIPKAGIDEPSFHVLREYVRNSQLSAAEGTKHRGDEGGVDFGRKNNDARVHWALWYNGKQGKRRYCRGNYIVGVKPEIRPYN